MNKKKRFSIITFIVGLVVLVGGAGFLIFSILKKPDMRDADFLVENHTWVENDTSGVIWNFTEIGKGNLTTNNHKNDYDFIWAIEGDKLKIETDWLYDLENEYTYKINQDEKTLELTDENGKTYNFTALTEETKEEPPITEENAE